MGEPKQFRSSRLFNSPLEIGMRTLFVLNEARVPCDLQRLTIYDYFLLHSSDISQEVASLHPPSPYRSSELLIKRPLIEQGLTLMVAKGLVAISFSGSGIEYVATEYAGKFLEYFTSPYANRVRTIAAWVRDNFQDVDNARLQNLVNSRIGQWGSEFISETLVEEELP